MKENLVTFSRFFTRAASLLLSVLFLMLPAKAEDPLPFDAPSSVNSLPESALVETSKGNFEILFYRDKAPISVRSIEYLGKKRFYENLTFHRYVPNFIIQGGDPQGTGKGGPGYTLPPELSELRHVRGTVGMARKPGQVNPERRSNGSQFYISLTEAPHLDGLYTVVGRVVSGMEVVEQLRPGDKILQVKFPK